MSKILSKGNKETCVTTCTFCFSNIEFNVEDLFLMDMSKFRQANRHLIICPNSECKEYIAIQISVYWDNENIKSYDWQSNF
jgi:hypothetical protein